MNVCAGCSLVYEVPEVVVMVVVGGVERPGHGEEGEGGMLAASAKKRPTKSGKANPV